MRKSLIILEILLMLSLGILVSAVTTVDAQHERITITEETLFGDPAAAEGLQISTHVHDQHRLFWDTTYDAGPDPRPETVFTYHDQRIYEQWESVGSFSLQPSHLNSGFSGIVDLEAEMQHQQEFSDSPVLWLPVKDVADRTKANEERVEQIRLSDYYDWFPMGYLFDPQSGTRYYDDENNLLQFFEKNFPIPVPEDLELTVTVSKDEAGRIYNVDYYETKGMMLNTYSNAVVLEDGVFFGMFGEADFSHFAQGYGLYYMPVEKDETITTLNTRTRELIPKVYLKQQCENIYPMNPADCEEGSLYLSADGQQVYAFTKEQGQVRLTVIDSHTRQILQQIDTGNAHTPMVWCQGEVVAIVTGDEAWENFRLQIWLVKDGLLQPWLDTEMYRFSDESVNWYVNPVIVFDGQRLAMVRYHDHYNYASHRVLIYDSSGLLYAGDYHHSGDDLYDNLQTWDGGLQVRWK